MTDIAKLRDDVIKHQRDRLKAAEAQLLAWKGKLADEVLASAVAGRGSFNDFTASLVRDAEKIVEGVRQELRVAEEAAKKPRLMPPEVCAYQLYGSDAVRARDSEWMAAIRRLPTRKREHGPSEGDCWPRSKPSYATTVDLADIEALAESAK